MRIPLVEVRKPILFWNSSLAIASCWAGPCCSSLWHIKLLGVCLQVPEGLQEGSDTNRTLVDTRYELHPLDILSGMPPHLDPRIYSQAPSSLEARSNAFNVSLSDDHPRPSICTFPFIFFRLFATVSNMFKTRNDDRPMTPKLNSVALPPGSPLRRTPSSTPKSSIAERLFSRLTPDRRSATPQSESPRRRQDMQYQDNSPRERTLSTRIESPFSSRLSKAALEVAVGKPGVPVDMSAVKCGPLKFSEPNRNAST
ncbi:hypothetical protein BDQ12DRAFT_337081 [Crucibulum laeve]|uniref:Uncharacterized protein n=1 Tax=Crucibulum laeve TaxID=68775 RepID=A0A5C3LRU3_9AGAR|nr:hypothetical protein BDQ12DRAFT_337081 [Crucibulum laeve]